MKLSSFIFAAGLAVLAGAAGAERSISLAEIPGLSDSAEEGIFPDLVRAIEGVVSTPYTITVQPFERSVRSVGVGGSEAHFPLLDPENGSTPGPGMVFSSTPVYHVVFMIYHRPDTVVDLNDLGALKIETDVAHTRMFNFPTIGSSCIACSLRKIQAGRLDAFIFAKNSVKRVMEAEGITGLEQTTFGRFPVRFVIAEGNESLDAELTAGIQQLASTGELQSILGPLWE